MTRIEPRTGTAGRPIRVGNGPTAVAAGEGAVWVVNRHDGTLSRIDPDDQRWCRGRIRVGSDPSAVTAGGGAVWVAGGDDGTVVRVDPQGPRVVEAIDVGSPATAIAIAGGRVWTTAGAAVGRAPGRHAAGAVPEDHSGRARDRLADPAPATTGVTFQVTSLAYDGLVAYRRVHGASGSTIVGGLATEAPAPSPDGRTYIFTLRSRLRYSDGSPVRPEDFRTSLERFLRVTRGSLPPFYDAIVGARRCVRQPTRCDLSAGIVTDPASRTITVHLTRPDSDLLHKLTLPFAYVVPGRHSGPDDRRPPAPRDRPVSDHGVGRSVAAGDWSAIRTSEPGSGAREWLRRSHRGQRAPRRDGSSKQIADVERGAADLAFLAEPFESLVRPRAS